MNWAPDVTYFVAKPAAVAAKMQRALVHSKTQISVPLVARIAQEGRPFVFK